MSKTNILIVEDEAIVAADLAGKLRQLGYEVAGIAAGGEEAVRLASRLRPHLVLMDIWLKGPMDGIQAADVIRHHQDVPVIYLTAHSDAATLARAKLTDPFGYILKPYEERELATHIEMALYKHETHRQLREQREWLRVTLNSIGDAVITCDIKGRVTFLNPMAEVLTGFTGAEALGKPIQSVFRLINEQSREPVEDPVALVLREGRAKALANHSSLVTKGGHEVPVEDSVAPILDASGELIGVVLVFHDVTEKRGVQKALRESEGRFRLLSKTAGGLLATDNPQGIVNELCRAVMAHLDCQAFFNFLVDEAAGRLHLNACAGIPEEEARKIEWLDYGVAVCGCAARDAARIAAEDIFHTLDPRTELVKSYGIQAYACHPLISQGRLIGTLSFGTRTRSRFSAQDLDLMKTVSDQVAVAMERMRLIDALQRSRDELEKRVEERTAELARSNRELQDFASVASHDLQEPLRKVQAFGNLLAEKYGESLDDEGRDYLARMKSAAARMQVLIGSLLDYSRLTSRAVPFSEVNLNEAANEALLNLEIRIKETGGHVVVDGLPIIRADRSQVVQLFQNLIGNGLKFHKESDPPRVKVYARPGKGTKRGKSDSWEITVEDNGIGFDETKVDRIFEPFQRLHARSSPYSGTGMGLAICRKIVERHGGTITAKSEVGKGSAFVITLPKN
jgi:PAS domain S-box-containing protein